MMSRTLVALGALVALMSIGCGASATERFVSREAAQTFRQEMTSALNESGHLGQMETAAEEIITLIKETGTLDKWASSLTGFYNNPALIIEQYERRGLKVGIEGGAGTLDLSAGGAGSALTVSQQKAMHEMAAELVASGDPAKVAFARELLDTMRRAQGIEQVPLGRPPE